jgi:hypothetical protein
MNQQSVSQIFNPRKFEAAIETIEAIELAEVETNLTPSDMSEYNEYLDSINTDAPLPTPEDFIFHKNMGMAPAELIDDMPIGTVDESTRIFDTLVQIKIGDSIVIDSVLVKRADRHTYNAQRKWSNGQYGNWALQGYDAKAVTDYILNPPAVWFVV